MNGGRLSSTIVADCRVRLNGKLPEGAAADLVAVTVYDDLAVPSMCTLRLVNWDVAKTQVTWVDHPLFAEGNTVEIELGYTGRLTRLMAGEITGLEPEFAAGMTPMLVVRGYDRRHRLMRGRKTRSFTRMKDSAIAKRVATDAGLQATVHDTQEVLEYVMQHNQTDLDFLRERAARIGYEVVVDDRTLAFRPPPLAEAAVVSLTHGQDLIEFYPRLSTMGQVDELDVRGWDTHKRATFTAKASAVRDTMGGETSGPSSAQTAFGHHPAASVDLALQNAADAQRVASGHFQSMALEFVQGTGACIGNPQIRAGRVITIAGVGKRFSGRYYVTSAIHSYTPQRGYRTEFEVRRTAT